MRSPKVRSYEKRRVEGLKRRESVEVVHAFWCENYVIDYCLICIYKIAWFPVADDMSSTSTVLLGLDVRRLFKAFCQSTC